MNSLRLSFFTLSAGVLLVACFPVSEPIGETWTSGETAPSTAPPDGTDTDGVSSATGTDTGALTDTNTDTGALTDTNTDTGAPEDPFCAPPEGFWGVQHGKGFGGADWGLVAEPCVLQAIESFAGGDSFVLDCPLWQQETGASAFSFSITDGPMPDPLPEIGATLDVFADRREITLDNDGGTLVVRRDGALVYAALRDLHLVHPDAPGPEIYAPLAVSRVDACSLAPAFEEDSFGPMTGDGFLCSEAARARLRVALPGGEPLELADGDAAVVSGDGLAYAVDVERAWRVSDCAPDFPKGEMEVMTLAIAVQPG